MSFKVLVSHIKKVTYMKGIDKKVIDKELNLDSLYSLSDQEVIEQLSSLDDIGVWTAELTLLFNMESENIFSYGDLAIQRGRRMVYHYKKITRELFEKYRRKFSPYQIYSSVCY